MGHVTVIAGTLTVRYGRFFPHKLSYIDEDSAQKTNNASEICCFFSTFARVYTRSSPLCCKFVCTSVVFNLKHVPGAFFQFYPIYAMLK